MRELALFAGAGGGILGGHLLGWRTVCAVEIDNYARSVLLARQRDGMLPRFPIWDDVTTFNGCEWRGRVDVVSGGFPCQDISAAGRGAGIDGSRSGLWAEMARIVGEVQPRYVFVENSPMLTSRGLGRVLGDLSELGFDAEWGVVSAADVGAPHLRKRIWILAHSQYGGLSKRRGTKDDPRHGYRSSRTRDYDIKSGAEQEGEILANSSGGGCTRQGRAINALYTKKDPEWQTSQSVDDVRWWSTEPQLGRVAYGVANRVDRIRTLGNGQVPAVETTAFRILHQRLNGGDHEDTEV